jgi:hypothetical protein
MATNGNPPPGAATDARGVPVRDPSTNVMDVVDAAVERLDDLRISALERVSDAVIHVEKMAALRASYDDKLRVAEAARIDAIRAVDVSAVAQAAQVAETRATTLANQVQQSAETVRTLVATTATAATSALAAALDPMQKDIAELRKLQYEQAGQKSAGSDPITLLLNEILATQNRGKGASQGEDRSEAAQMAIAAAKSARTSILVAASGAGGFFLYLAIAIMTHGKF